MYMYPKILGSCPDRTFFFQCVRNLNFSGKICLSFDFLCFVGLVAISGNSFVLSEVYD